MPDTAPIAYTLRAISTTGDKKVVEVAPGDAISVQGDRFGNILFPVEAVPVPADKFNEGLNRCLEVAKSIVTKTSNFASSFQVETVTLKLALDAGVGVVFVGEAKIEAGIEIEIKRVLKPGDAPAPGKNSD